MRTAALSCSAFLLASLASAVDADTDFHRRSHNLPRPPHAHNARHGHIASIEERQDQGEPFEGYRSVGYYVNWVVYEPYNYLINQVPIEQYTHLLYSFGNMSADGTVFLSDDWADTKLPYGGSFAGEGNLGGNLKELYLMKKRNRHLKTLLSIGGWSYRFMFEKVVDASWRAKFVESSIKLILDLGMDGIDIDYEWANAETKEGTASLVVELRAGLDRAASEIGASRLLLSYAAPCGSAYKFLDIPKMDAALSFWNLMAYDFSGGFTKQTKPSANLYVDPAPLSSKVSGKTCVDFFLQNGATARKLNLGSPLYAAAWNGTQGMYSNWTDRGDGDDNTGGYYKVKSLPLEEEVVYYDESLGASWSYNDKTGHLTSYDIPQVSLQKTKYVAENQLGGMMWWAIDEDWQTPSSSSSSSSSGDNSPQRRSGMRSAQNSRKSRDFEREHVNVTVKPAVAVAGGGRESKRACKRKGLQAGNLAAAPNGTVNDPVMTSTISASTSSSASASDGSLSAASSQIASASNSASTTSDANPSATPVDGFSASPSVKVSDSSSPSSSVAIHATTSTLSSPVASNTSISTEPSSSNASSTTSSSTTLPSTSTLSSTSPSASASPSPSPSSSTSNSSSSNPFASTNPHATSDLAPSVDGIDLGLGRSLVLVSKEGFEKYTAEGLDKSENVLNFPSSSYANVKAGME